MRSSTSPHAPCNSLLSLWKGNKLFQWHHNCQASLQLLQCKIQSMSIIYFSLLIMRKVAGGNRKLYLIFIFICALYLKNRSSTTPLVFSTSLLFHVYCVLLYFLFQPRPKQISNLYSAPTIYSTPTGWSLNYPAIVDAPLNRICHYRHNHAAYWWFTTIF